MLNKRPLVVLGFMLLVAWGAPLVGMGMAMATASAGMLRLGLHVSAAGSLDPHVAAGSQDRVVADMLFNGLLRYQPGDAPHLEPDLAESIPDFEMVDGRQVWTVRLRKGVLFHAAPTTPAYELTADDVVFSLNKSKTPETSAYAGEYEGITAASVDRYTVRLTVAEPMSAMLFLPKLANYAGGFIVSQRAIQSMGTDGFNRHPVGTGPFVFSGYTPGSELVLSAHADYFRGRPALDGVRIRYMPDARDRQAALLRSDLDVIMGSGEKGWVEETAAAEGIIVDSFGVGEVVSLYLNTRLPPLDDIRVRQAIAYALDREQFARSINPRFVEGVSSPIPAALLPGGLEREVVHRLGLAYDVDLARARRLMGDAGYPQGFKLSLVSSEKRLYRSCYAEIRRQLARIGIDCRIQVMNHSRMHRQIRQKPLPLVLYVAWRPNPDTYLSQFFHSDAIIVNGRHPDTNFAHYDRIDNLIEAARLETASDRQVRLWEQAQIRILDDMVVYPIMYTKQCYARRAVVDYGHPLVATMALYPQFTERTRIGPAP